MPKTRKLVALYRSEKVYRGIRGGESLSKGRKRKRDRYLPLSVQRRMQQNPTLTSKYLKNFSIPVRKRKGYSRVIKDEPASPKQKKRKRRKQKALGRQRKTRQLRLS